MPETHTAQNDSFPVRPYRLEQRGRSVTQILFSFDTEDWIASRTFQSLKLFEGNGFIPERTSFRGSGMFYTDAL